MSIHTASRFPRFVASLVLVGFLVLVAISAGAFRGPGAPPSISIADAYSACHQAFEARGTSSPARFGEPGVLLVDAIPRITYTFSAHRVRCSAARGSDGRVHVLMQSAKAPAP